MKIIPAIDIIGGQCVRLSEGDFDTKKVYHADPLEAACAFEEAGLEYLHLVDLDGARFMTYQAAWRIARDLPATKEVAMAKAWTSEASKRVTMLGHQIHGAVSFCEEHDLHLFYRKAKAGAVSFGDEDYHLEKIAENLEL